MQPYLGYPSPSARRSSPLAAIALSPFTRGPAPDFPSLSQKTMPSYALPQCLDGKARSLKRAVNRTLNSYKSSKHCAALSAGVLCQLIPMNNIAVWVGVSFIEFDLSTAAWSRIIDEYEDSSLPQALANSGAQTLEALDATIRSWDLARGKPNPGGEVERKQHPALTCGLGHPTCHRSLAC